MKYYTHCGIFHADEVTGYAVTLLAEVCNTVVRLESLDNIPTDGIIADIGRQYKPQEFKFDHHQGLILRENGVPYASAGLLWKEYGRFILNSTYKVNSLEKRERIFKMVDESFFQGIDAHDSDSQYKVKATCQGGEVQVLTYSGMISILNDVSSTEKSNIAFELSANIAYRTLRLKIEEAIDIVNSIEEFGKKVKIQGRIAVLDENLRWKRAIHENYPDILFIVKPSFHSGSKWNVQGIPVEPSSRDLKIKIERPEWFDGFIHQGKFIAGHDDKELLVKLAEWNIQQHDLINEE